MQSDLVLLRLACPRIEKAEEHDRSRESETHQEQALEKVELLVLFGSCCACSTQASLSKLAAHQFPLAEKLSATARGVKAALRLHQPK